MKRISGNFPILYQNIRRKTILKKKISFLCIVTLLCSLNFTACQIPESNPLDTVTQSSDETSSLPSFDRYVDTLFTDLVKSDTLTLHFMLEHPESYGITDYPITLGDCSADSVEENQAKQSEILDTLHRYSYDTLSREQKLTYDVLTDSIELQQKLDSMLLYQEVLNPLTGTQAQLPVLLAEYKFRSEQDVKDYLALLEQIDDLFDSILEFEQRKSDAGLFMADFAVNDVLEQCQEFTSDPENNYLLHTFEERLSQVADLEEAQAELYKEQNKTLVLDTVIPAYEALVQGLTNLLGHGKNEGGLCHFEDGKAYYELLVSSATGSDASVHTLERKTEKQRRKDLTAMQELLKKNPSLSSADTATALSVTEPNDMLKRLKEKVTASFPASEIEAFEIKYVDPSLEDYLSPAFYLTAPLDNPNENAIYINRASNYSGLKLFTTLAHEGYPGHMYQTNVTQSAGLPAIRSLLSYPGYTEGWATYVEMLSYGYADLPPAEASMLQKNQSILLSLYATCDMKIHYDGWGLADVSSFFETYGITDSDSISEIYHLIIETPANYLKYYIGYLEFLSLKEDYKKVRGDAYSDQEFHQKVLTLGEAPFAILKKYMVDE